MFTINRFTTQKWPTIIHQENRDIFQYLRKINEGLIILPSNKNKNPLITILNSKILVENFNIQFLNIYT